MNVQRTGAAMATGGMQTQAIDAQIAKITAQVVKLASKLQEIYGSDAAAKQKEAQAKAVQQEIELCRTCSRN